MTENVIYLQSHRWNNSFDLTPNFSSLFPVGQKENNKPKIIYKLIVLTIISREQNTSYNSNALYSEKCLLIKTSSIALLAKFCWESYLLKKGRAERRGHIWKMLDDQGSTPNKELELTQEDLCNRKRGDKRKFYICGEAVKEKNK